MGDSTAAVLGAPKTADAGVRAVGSVAAVWGAARGARAGTGGCGTPRSTNGPPLAILEGGGNTGGSMRSPAAVRTQYTTRPMAHNHPHMHTETKDNVRCVTTCAPTHTRTAERGTSRTDATPHTAHRTAPVFAMRARRADMANSASRSMSSCVVTRFRRARSINPCASAMTQNPLSSPRTRTLPRRRRRRGVSPTAGPLSLAAAPPPPPPPPPGDAEAEVGAGRRSLGIPTSSVSTFRGGVCTDGGTGPKAPAVGGCGAMATGANTPGLDTPGCTPSRACLGGVEAAEAPLTCVSRAVAEAEDAADAGVSST